MDPNLTLAHISHNTAVVLLHQGIAYPSPEWQTIPINLPSASSADTCLAAAIEVSIIAEEFLRNTDFLTNPQFAFCLFVCGRMLIAHSLYYQIHLPPELDNLISSLYEMSRRWSGDHSASTENLASKFALRLEHARRSGLQNADMRQAAYSEDQAPSVAVSPRLDGNNTQNVTQEHDTSHRPLGTFGEVMPLPVCQGESPDSITLAFPPLPLAFQAQGATEVQGRAPTAPMLNCDMHEAGATYHQNAHLSSEVPLGSNITFEDMASYLDYSFLPDQRVSAYSNPGM